jgi:hypothetical protein
MHPIHISPTFGLFDAELDNSASLQFLVDDFASGARD